MTATQNLVSSHDTQSEHQDSKTSLAWVNELEQILNFNINKLTRNHL